jgi:hypothetical protein
MRLRLMLLLCAAFALTVGVATAAAAPGSNSANAKLCQKGGWTSLYTAKGGTFLSEEACVAYTAQGGTVYPAVADVSLSSEYTLYSQAPGGEVLFWPGYEIYATNAGPSSVTIGVQSTDGSQGRITLAPGETQQVWFVGPGYSTEVGGQICFEERWGWVQVLAASAFDPDSTPNNYANGYGGPAVEDDEVWVDNYAICGAY